MAELSEIEQANRRYNESLRLDVGNQLNYDPDWSMRVLSVAAQTGLQLEVIEHSLPELEEELRKACERSGRDYESIDRAIFAANPSEDACRANQDMGFTDQMFALPSESAEKVLPRLDKLADLVRKIR